MSSIPGYYDGKYIIPEQSTVLKKNQKVIITILDEDRSAREKINFFKFRGVAKGIWSSDAQNYVKGLRNEEKA